MTNIFPIEKQMFQDVCPVFQLFQTIGRLRIMEFMCILLS